MNLARLFVAEVANLKRALRRYDDAVSSEDIVQDTFLRLFSVNSDNIRSPRAFLIRTARNLAIDALRRNKAVPMHAEMDLDHYPDEAATPEQILVAEEEAAAVRAALAALPEKQRKALVLRRVDGLPPSEVAARLGVTVRQTQRLVAEATAACHAYLRAYRDNSDAPR